MQKIDWLCLGVMFCAVFLLSTSPYEKEEMRASGLNNSFNSLLGGTFKNYAQQAVMIIKKSRLDLDDHNADFTVRANSPFILYPPKWCKRRDDKTYEKGVILIHDLGASPYQMQELGYYLSSQCYMVYAPLLAGHGTRPGDLLNVSYKDWLLQVSHAMREMKNEAQKVFLGGHGMGGALAMHYALNNVDPFLSGLILSATPTRVSKLSYMFLSVMSAFKNWGSLYMNKDRVRYETIAINGVQQKNYVLQEIEGMLIRADGLLVHMPVFGVYSTEDNNLDFQESVNLILSNTAALNRKIMIYTADVDKYSIMAKQDVNVDVVTGSNEEYRLYSLSHLALLHKLDDIWYGKSGAYRDCYRYQPNTDNYRLCSHDSNIWYGETGYFENNKNIIARPTFNPYLQNIFAELIKFLNNNNLNSI